MHCPPPYNMLSHSPTPSAMQPQQTRMNTGEDDSLCLAELISEVFFAISEAATSIAVTQRITDKGTLRDDMIDLHMFGVELFTLATAIQNLLSDQMQEFENSNTLDELIKELAKLLLVRSFLCRELVERGFHICDLTYANFIKTEGKSDRLESESPPTCDHEPRSTAKQILKTLSILDIAEQHKRLYLTAEIEQKTSTRLESLIGIIRSSFPEPKEPEYVFIEERTEIPLEYPDHVNGRFYNAVKHHMMNCNCEKAHENQEKQGHWAMLRLKPALETMKEDHFHFETIFSASIESKTKWQDIKIAVPRRYYKTPYLSELFD